jgi:hypothetical protein
MDDINNGPGHDGVFESFKESSSSTSTSEVGLASSSTAEMLLIMGIVVLVMVVFTDVVIWRCVICRRQKKTKNQIGISPITASNSLSIENHPSNQQQDHGSVNVRQQPRISSSNPTDSMHRTSSDLMNNGRLSTMREYITGEDEEVGHNEENTTAEDADVAIAHNSRV